MPNNLKLHFPMIRDRGEIVKKIEEIPKLKEMFYSWEETYQHEFLDFCTGVRGFKLLYDSFFKEILNPDTTPERLEALLSLILDCKVKILKVLPTDSSRIAAECCLLVLDIVVELEDGSIANIEMQKIGYAFPGQRSACYSADLLLRQYKRLKGEKGKKFSYKDIKKVYTIVFFEKSTSDFQRYPDIYLHHFQQKSDTGLELSLLQEYIFISLDIFKKTLDNNNKTITNELEAWLTFLCIDDPDMILRLIMDYPKFEDLYRDVYMLCLNLERMMEMFSKELAELDKNTVQYMIDEMQDTIDEQKDTIDEQKDTINEQKDMIDEQKDTIDEQNALINSLQESIVSLQKELEGLKDKLRK